MNSDDIIEEAKQEGIVEKTLMRAKRSWASNRGVVLGATQVGHLSP
jgi:hypothetical protein